MAEKTIINQIINYLEQEKINGIELASISLDNLNELKQNNLQDKKKFLLSEENSGKTCNNCLEYKKLFEQSNFIKNLKILIITDFSNNDKPFSINENKLVEKMLKAISVKNKDVEIIAIKKEPCHQALFKQINQLIPKTIMIMGVDALKIFVSDASLLKYENHWFNFNGIDTIATFHPQFLIKNPNWKKSTWVTLKKIKTKIN